MAKVDIETAENDYVKFTEILKLSELKQEKLKDEKEDIVQLIEFGYLQIGDEITYNLETPLEKGAELLEKIVFKNRRFTVKDIEKYTGGAKNDVELARRMLAALTGVNSGLLAGLDAEDFTKIGKISAFFLPR